MSARPLVSRAISARPVDMKATADFWTNRELIPLLGQIRNGVNLTGSRLVDIRSYGAAVDGSTDDAAAWQAAVDALGSDGGTVYCPTGTSVVNSRISFPNGASISVLGAGREKTSVDFRGAIPAGDFAVSTDIGTLTTYPLFYFDTATNCSVERISFHVRTQNAPVTCLWFANPYGVTVDQVTTGADGSSATGGIDPHDYAGIVVINTVALIPPRGQITISNWNNTMSAPPVRTRTFSLLVKGQGTSIRNVVLASGGNLEECAVQLYFDGATSCAMTGKWFLAGGYLGAATVYCTNSQECTFDGFESNQPQGRHAIITNSCVNLKFRDYSFSTPSDWFDATSGVDDQGDNTTWIGNGQGRMPTRHSELSRFTARSEGAVGNDDTDDTAAIQRALDKARNYTGAVNQGAVVYLHPGTYKITSALVLHSGVVLRGDDRSSTVIRQHTAATAVVTADSLDLWGIEGVHLAASSYIGIQITSTTDNVKRGVLRDLYVSGYASESGIEVVAAANDITGLVLENVFCLGQDSTHGTGILIHSSGLGLVKGALISGGHVQNSNVGVDIDSANGVYGANVVIDDCTTLLKFRSAARGCYLRISQNAGSYTNATMNDGTDCTVAGNFSGLSATLFSGGGTGISVQGLTQPGAAGVTTTGYTAHASANAVYAESTFTGNVGTSAYTMSDLVATLKTAGIIPI